MIRHITGASFTIFVIGCLMMASCFEFDQFGTVYFWISCLVIIFGVAAMYCDVKIGRLLEEADGWR